MEQEQNRSKRILIVSGDVLPLPGLPTTGAGFRAWGLGKGLEARGHEVHFLMPDVSLGKFASKVDIEAIRPYLFSYTNKEEALSRRIINIEPEILILQHWPMASKLQTIPHIPVIIDFHGPILLESLYQERADYQQLVQEKLQAIASKGDFFTCAGEKQRHYFFAWLIMAGFDLRNNSIGVVPVCVSPDLPKREPFEDDIHFVYGGVYLPWQDPILPLQTLLQTLENQGKGRLDFFGGQHGYLPLSTGPFEDLREKIHQSRQAKDYGMVPHAQLIDHYRRSHVAFDLMQRNPERELAFTTRTVEYLWCGLPVIYNDYGELAGYIKDYDAGWTVDPQDTKAIRAIIEQILQNPSIIEEKSVNAQRLARERLNWEKAVEPLDRFCRQSSVQRSNRLLSIDGLQERKDLVNLLNYSLPFVRRHRRSPLAVLTAWTKENGKKLLRRRYFTHKLDWPAFVLPILTQGQHHGQSFKAKENYLSRIDIMIATYQRVNTCDLTLHLRENPTATQDIRTVTLNTAFLQDNRFCKFTFEPIPNSKDRFFYFFIESPDGIVSDGISLFAYTECSNGHNQRYENGRPAEGELVYILDYHL